MTKQHLKKEIFFSKCNISVFLSTIPTCPNIMISLVFSVKMTIDSIKASDNLAATCYFQVPVKEREKSKGKHIFIRQSHGHMKSSNLTTI